MAMRMVRIGHVRVRMALRLVSMGVAVFGRRHRIVKMVVVAVVVPVRMLMLRRLVRVFVPMRFRQVQHDTGQHQRAPGRHAPAQ